MTNGPTRKKMAPPSLLTFNGSYIAYAHALLAYSAFLLALVVGCWLHYHKIVKNASFGYPDEWFPSVSATIGDRYPERSFFQVLIACTSGPRFMLVFLNFLAARQQARPTLAWILVISGILRTFTCAGWVYVTSTDDHDWHDISMIGYILLTLPWTICVTKASPKNTLLKKGRGWTGFVFFATLVPLVYWFIQHKVHVRAGAYSIYAYFEWLLILLDVGFDTWSAIEFKQFDISIGAEGAQIKPVAVEAAPVEKAVSLHVPLQKHLVMTEVDFSFFEFFVNTCNAFMFWSVLTSLLVCVWYFPLWHMGISGYEAVITVVFLAPLPLLIPPLNKLFLSFPQITKLLVVVLGLGSYKVETPEHRLMIITAGTGFGVIGLASDLILTKGSPKKYTSIWISFLLGLLGTSVAKHANFSNNPAWPIMKQDNGGYNEVFIVAGVVSALLYRKPTIMASNSERTGGLLLLASLGFGGFLFCIQAYLSDSSTLTYWNWEGYPVNGPTPLTGAIPHFVTFMAGLVTSLKVHPNSLLSPIYTLLAIASAYVLYTSNGWLGFAGSLGLVFYIASLGPLVGQAIAGHSIVGVFFCGFFINILLSLAHIWIVAYAFVPGGYLLRERTDLVLGASVVLLLCIGANYTLGNVKSHIIRLEVTGNNVLSHSLKIMTVLLSIAVATTYNRASVASPQPFNASSKTFTTGIWCVHFGLDNDMWSSETRMSNLLKDAEVDIVGLLETDTERLIGGNRDFTQKIAHDLGMYVDYGPGPNKHTWGAALLSKFPILNSTHHLLPSPVGELAPAIHATLDIYGELVDVVVFHSGQEEDVEDRRLQSLGVRDILGSSTRPLVLLSYLVTKPLEGNYNNYVSKESGVHDIDSTDWDRWCEYILFKDLKKVAYARVSRSTITDTELQIAKFKLLSEEEKLYGKDFLYGNHFIEESEVDPALRMPSILRGDGVRGHRYHVFDEPRYFATAPQEKFEAI